MNKAALITYIYPNAVKYIGNFKNTLDSQTCSSFDVYIFNDGVKDLDKYVEKINQNVTIVDVESKNISTVRFKSFSVLKNTQYDYFIFQDIDDGMSNNRIECIVEKLKFNPIVCNDLTTINDKVILEESVWSKRLKNNFTFKSDFIRSKNILGLGNTGVTKKVIDKTIKETIDISVVDWYVFYQWMSDNEHTALFTNECQTLYNQHDTNTAGMFSIITFEKLKQAIFVKEQQYNALSAWGYNFDDELSQLDKVKKILKNKLEINIKLTTPPFWWEYTNIYDENTIR